MDDVKSSTIELTDATFAAEVEDARGVTLVDFGASWCGPCRMMDPVVEQLAREYEGRMKIGKVDTDANPHTATRYGIRSLPTFILFRDGGPVEMVIGAVGRGALEKKILEHL